MKKLFSKIATLSVGLALAIGFGVAASSEKAVKANADTDAAYSFSTTSGTATSGKWSFLAAQNAGSSAPVFNSQLRLYAKNSITFTAASGYKLTGASFTCVVNANNKGVKPTGYTISSGQGSLSSYSNTMTSFTWTGASGGHDSFTFTINGTAGNLGLKSVAMTYQSTGPTKLATPSPVYNNDMHKVTWASVEHATSYEVSLDNSTYTAATSPYDGSFVDGTQYTVYVRALSSDANYSTSDPGSVTFTPSAPATYESVTVSKGELQGDTKGSAYIQCSAVVNGQHNPSQTVTWSITENSTFGTGTSIANKATIDQTGKVVFLDNVESLYVWALAADGETKGSNTVSASGLVAEKGTEGNPYTVSEAYDIAKELTVGSNNGKVVYVFGTATGDMEDKTYGSNFDLTDGHRTIRAYSIAGAQTTNPNNAGYVGEGYLVTVTGAIINHSTGGYEVGYAGSSLPSSLVSSVLPSYTVSFNANGGSGEMASVPDQRGSYTLPASTFTAPEGYAFAGWKANNAGELIAVGESYDVSANVTFYAQWGAIRNLTVNVTNGSATAESTIAENGTSLITIEPSEGYKVPTLSQENVDGATFVSFSNNQLTIKNPTKDVTVTVACVALANYTITVNATNCTYTGASSIQENGEATITFTANEGYSLPTLENVTVTGATKVSFTNGALVINNPTGNVSITVSGAQYANDVAHIVSGGQYKIYHTVSSVKYYLVGTTGNNAQAFTTKSWEATVFTFTLVGDNAISIVSGENALYNTDNNNGVRFGLEETTWTISEGTHYDLNKKDLVVDGDGYYNLKGSYDRYLGLYMGTNNTTPTDFRCYQFNKPDTGTKTYNLARMSATQFEYFDSSAFAQDLLSATNTVCSQSGSHTASQFSDMWGLLETSYKALPSADKTAFDTADRNEGGTVLEQAAARYDQVAGKYSLKNFASRTPILVRSTTPIFDSGAKNFGYILVISISGLTILAIGLLLVYKRKHR